jgi:hypothetical protein
MKIKIEAYLYAPSLLQFYGGANPIIVTGFFQKEISDKEKSKLKCGKKIIYKGIELKIGLRKGKVITCSGNLPSVSVSFFKKLEKDGWKINKDAKIFYGFPNDQTDKRLIEEIEKFRKEYKKIVRVQKSLRKTFKKFKKKNDEKNEKSSFKNFPQVH